MHIDFYCCMQLLFDNPPTSHSEHYVQDMNEWSISYCIAHLSHINTLAVTQEWLDYAAEGF